MPLAFWIAVAAAAWILIAVVVALGLGAVFRSLDGPRVPDLERASSVSAGSALGDDGDDEALDQVVLPA